MRIPYYPGCTLSTKAKGFDRAARDSFAALGIELAELKMWNCCGATFPLSQDNLLDLAGPVRNLVSAAEEGEQLAVACSTCFNVLKRSNLVMRDDEDKREKINFFIEAEYAGGVEILHLLEILRDQVGWDKVAEAVKKPLTGLKVAPYYGCMYLRPPKEMGFDDHENPQILENYIRAMGAEVADYPHRAECCGNYIATFDVETTQEMAYMILASTRRADADLIITSCPLCQFNLDRWQTDIALKHGGFRPIPVLYDTQLLGIALGLDTSGFDLDKLYVDPMPVLREKGLL
jgi:heterodisulfide reductase subunit B